MIVEDERITAEDLKEGLEELGYTVSAVVYSGEEAIKIAIKTRSNNNGHPFRG